MPTLYARIPEDRVAVLIGPGGRTKREIARRTGASLEIDAEDGEVRVHAPDTDPLAALRARDIALAIGRGFAPARALRLARDGVMLAILDIKLETGKREKEALRRIRARVIGTGGRARERIEELSGCAVSVYGSTIALIGEPEQIERGQRAVELLVRGSEHSTVFHLLTRLRFDAQLARATAPEDDPPAE
ncbi:MAG: KH domain-containing protein [Thermoplasmata archaeon]